MFCLTEIIVQSDPSLQELAEKIKNAPSLAMMILAAVQLGRAVAVKVVEEILNERGQAPTKWPLCSQCGSKLESKGLESCEMLTLVGLIK
jgi:hypothetical protein